MRLYKRISFVKSDFKSVPRLNYLLYSLRCNLTISQLYISREHARLPSCGEENIEGTFIFPLPLD
jgi:hypothetical protein